MRHEDETLAPRELLRGALNISRAAEIADRESDDRIADECMAMLLQHLHMAKVVLVHSDLLLAGNIERAAQEILREARDDGHITHYLSNPAYSSPVAAERSSPPRLYSGRRSAIATMDRAGRSRGRAWRCRAPRAGLSAAARPSRPPHAV